MKKLFFLLSAIIFVGGGCSQATTNQNTPPSNSANQNTVEQTENYVTLPIEENKTPNNTVTKGPMLLTSPNFAAGGTIPAKHTCDGQDVNPVLNISDVPENTKSLALVLEDPDAPGGVFVHWVIWNIDPKTSVIPENYRLGKTGVNDFDETRYGGPCPPANHRYYFRLYALDNNVETKGLLNASQLLTTIDGHILAQAELMGKYGPSK
ncbi:MAG TPA: YbhB/YbcL family Raf kinase inhibitor-like protein [Patescibacteria group bacterium]|nr:YbhB/YbcL family Raf kinase inhibitor-like protein [Patescibacteria group bacterium]